MLASPPHGKRRLYLMLPVKVITWALFSPLLQVVQRGPYIYQEHDEKIDVAFIANHHNIAFQMWSKQRFNEELTKQQCGSDCSEGDNVSHHAFYTITWSHPADITTQGLEGLFCYLTVRTDSSCLRKQKWSKETTHTMNDWIQEISWKRK